MPDPDLDELRHLLTTSDPRAVAAYPCNTSEEWAGRVRALLPSVIEAVEERDRLRLGFMVDEVMLESERVAAERVAAERDRLRARLEAVERERDEARREALDLKVSRNPLDNAMHRMWEEQKHRAETAEARLAKAVDALETLLNRGHWGTPRWTFCIPVAGGWNAIVNARDVLAEIKKAPDVE